MRFLRQKRAPKNQSQNQRKRWVISARQLARGRDQGPVEGKLGRIAKAKLMTLKSP
jgi:hypothetical protein